MLCDDIFRAPLPCQNIQLQRRESKNPGRFHKVTFSASRKAIHLADRRINFWASKAASMANGELVDQLLGKGRRRVDLKASM